jgi:tetrahydromethanopterin S-methyltransferase subunit C
LLTAFGVAAWRAASRASPDSARRALVMGLACGMLAHQVFGLTDAFILGTKLGIVMWVYLAFIAVLGGLPIK